MKWQSAIVLLLLALLFPPAARAAPESCAGYAEPRVWVESQAWWQNTPGSGGKEFGHLHTALCFPLAQRVRGVVPLDIKLHFHMNPGRLESLTVQISPDGSGQYVAAQKKFKPALTCPTEDCDFWVHLDADTSRLGVDGQHEWRIRPKITEPDGNTLVGSTSYTAYTANGGRPIKNYREQGLTQGKGWYSKTGYAQAQFYGPLSTGPVSGRWSVQVGCHASDKPVSACIVTVDPDFHHGDFGRMQLRYKGAWKGSVTVDTAALAPGPHRLVVRTDVNDPRGSTLSGLLVVPFEVRN